jgi:hypothetical protein
MPLAPETLILSGQTRSYLYNTELDVFLQPKFSADRQEIETA